MKMPFLFFAFLVLGACQTPRYAADQLPSERLVFGTGGGFSGIETSYTLIHSGQLWVRQGVGAPFTEIKGTMPGRAKTMMKAASGLVYGQVALNQTGNTYSFMEYASQERSSRITWTGKLPPVDPALSRLIEDAFSLIPAK